MNGEETNGDPPSPGGGTPPPLPAGKRRRFPASIPLRALLIVLAVSSFFGVVVTGWYAFENVRGRRALEACQRELAAQGESLKAEDFIPPPVPDDRNAAMAAIFARTLDYRVDPKTGALTFGPHKPADTLFASMPFGKEGKRPSSSLGGWMSGHALPLDRWQQHYAEQADFPHPARPGTPSDDVLWSLTRFAPVLDEAEQTFAERPQIRFPVNWMQVPPSTIQLPHLDLVQKITSVLRLRAVAKLAAGRHAEAAREVATGFRLRASAQTEPMFIGHLVAITCDGLLLQAVWEGLARREWTADELLAIQTDLRGGDLLKDYAQSLRGERAIFFCRTMDGFRKTRDMRQFFGIGNTFSEHPLPTAYLRALDLAPRGWIDQNEASVCLGYQELATKVVDLKARRVFPERLKALIDERAFVSRVFAPQTFMAKIILPVCASVLTRSVRAQAACEQAETACALERYFCDRRIYPEKLDALVPAYLDRVPTDLIDGASMRYARTNDGRYRLHCVGWNGRDDGGEIAWTQTGSNDMKPDDKLGDWVWQYQPIEPP